MTKTPAPQSEPSSGDTNLHFCLWVSLAFAPIAPVAALLVGNPVWPAALVSVTLAGAAFLAAQVGASLAKWAVMVALIGQTIAFTAAMAGHPWQIDTHMQYFAVLATVAILYDIPVLLAAAGLIAVHHLGMALFMPAMVYPGMAEGVVARTALHAGIVVIETVILVLAIRAYGRARAQTASQADTLRAARARSEAAQHEAEKLQQEAAQVIARVGLVLKSFAAQDFRPMLDDPLGPQYEPLRQDINAMAAQLRNTLGRSTATAHDFTDRARALAGASDTLSTRTETQAASLSQTADGLKNLAGSLQDAAAGAGRANETATRARDVAVRNGDIVGKAVQAMKQIEESSGQISTMLNMIEDISFQTNLLALNAGVEAARAGEFGRGFAVVASEVGALAQRTSTAAQDVKDMIGKSAAEVKNGSRLVNAAGQALADIVDQCTQSSTMIGEISAAIGGQAGIVKDINASLQTLDQATQHNAAMCQEMTALGNQIAAGAQDLSSALAGFVIADSAAPARRPRAA